MRLDFVCTSKIQFVHDLWLHGFVALRFDNSPAFPQSADLLSDSSGMDQGQEAERKHAEVQRVLTKVKDDQRRRA